MTELEDRIFTMLEGCKTDIETNPGSLKTMLSSIRECLDAQRQRVPAHVWNATNAFCASLIEGLEHFPASSQKFSTAERVISSLRPVSSDTDKAGHVIILWCRSILCLLRGELRECAITTYSACELAPAVAVNVFPAGFFSKDYRAILLPCLKELNRSNYVAKSTGRSNRVRKIMGPLTFLVRSLLMIPVSNLYACVVASGLVRLDAHELRRLPYKTRIVKIHQQQLTNFDLFARRNLLATDLSDQQKMDLAIDQIKRQTSIYRSHLLSVSQESSQNKASLESASAS